MIKKSPLLTLSNIVIGVFVALGVYFLTMQLKQVILQSSHEWEEEWIEALPDRYVACEECMAHPKFMSVEKPDSASLSEALAYYKIQYPEIVQAQVQLESNNFKSAIYRRYNNLFGLWNTRTKDYYKFTYWWESVLAYKLFIQSRYEPPNDYYEFLQEVGYAKDSSYIPRLKRIVSKNNHN